MKALLVGHSLSQAAVAVLASGAVGREIAPGRPIPLKEEAPAASSKLKKPRQKKLRFVHGAVVIPKATQKREMARRLRQIERHKAKQALRTEIRSV